VTSEPSRPTDTPSFDVDPRRGFLPPHDPLTTLGPRYAPLEEAAADLPKLLVSTRLRRRLERLPEISTDDLSTSAELERAMLLLSYLGHAYVWGDRIPPTAVPPCLARPWCTVARRLGRPPILSYASYALHNWRRIDSRGPVEAGNLGLLENFWGGADEEWFVVIHVDIENKAAPALQALPQAQQAAVAGDHGALAEHLDTIAVAMERMYSALERMRELCDPYIYYRRVRPYIFGWKDHPALPDGLIYEGVDELRGLPQKFRGETGAQSSIIPSLDAVLGVRHADDPLRTYLLEMRDYMPTGHRRYIASLEAGPSVRDVVIEAGDETLCSHYDRCVELLRAFRAKHLEYAASYIQRQSQVAATNPTEVGTGGTPFMQYLKKHRDETAGHVLNTTPPPP
jgi:indoleamine 2,3-dioxygenase